jgi:hypothetical protein
VSFTSDVFCAAAAAAAAALLRGGGDASMETQHEPWSGSGQHLTRWMKLILAAASWF